MKRLMIILCVLLSGVAMGVVQYQIPYGVASTVYFPLYDSNSPWNIYGTAPATADVNVVEDLEAPASATNAIVDNNGVMAWTISATEATSKTIQLLVQDASAPPLYMDQVVILTTYGHATAAFLQPTTAAGTFNDLATSAENAEEIWEDPNAGLMAAAVESGNKLILFGEDANGLTENDSVSATMDPNTLTTSDNPRWSVGWLLRKTFGGI